MTRAYCQARTPGIEIGIGRSAQVAVTVLINFRAYTRNALKSLGVETAIPGAGARRQ